MTMTEKILARASEGASLEPGENVWVDVDVLMTHDVCGPGTIEIFTQEFGEDAKVWDHEKANPDYKGTCHIALAQEGHCRTGKVLLGTDSHTCNAGAFGQFATGIGNTDAGFVMGTGKALLKVPPTIRFVLDGEMPPYLLAKDLILQSKKEAYLGLSDATMLVDGSSMVVWLAAGEREQRQVHGAGGEEAQPALRGRRVKLEVDTAPSLQEGMEKTFGKKK